MSGFCCTPKKGLNNDSSMNLLLSVVAARTRPTTGWPAADPNDRTRTCCPGDRNGGACNCNGNAHPLNKTNIYRNNQIYQIIKNCPC